MTDKQKQAIRILNNLNERCGDDVFNEEDYSILLEFVVGEPQLQYIPFTTALNAASNIDKEYVDNEDYIGGYIEGFENGAGWSDEHPKNGLVSIDKVCKWIDENVEDHTRFYEDYNVHEVVVSNYALKREFIEEFKKAMEEQQ